MGGAGVAAAGAVRPPRAGSRAVRRAAAGGPGTAARGVTRAATTRAGIPAGTTPAAVAATRPAAAGRPAGAGRRAAVAAGAAAPADRVSLTRVSLTRVGLRGPVRRRSVLRPRPSTPPRGPSVHRPGPSTPYCGGLPRAPAGQHPAGAFCLSVPVPAVSAPAPAAVTHLSSWSRSPDAQPLAARQQGAPSAPQLPSRLAPYPHHRRFVERMNSGAPGGMETPSTWVKTL